MLSVLPLAETGFLTENPHFSTKHLVLETRFLWDSTPTPTQGTSIKFGGGEGMGRTRNRVSYGKPPFQHEAPRFRNPVSTDATPIHPEQLPPTGDPPPNFPAVRARRYQYFSYHRYINDAVPLPKSRLMTRNLDRNPVSQNSPHPHKGPSAKIDKKTWFLRDANVTSCAIITFIHINKTGL